MPAMINQTITVVNKSGKIVSTSKHLVNVFNEAKSAYNERKAEIRSMRRNDLEIKDQERKARKQLEALALYDEDDQRSHKSRRSSRGGSEDGRPAARRRTTRTERPPVERGVSDGFLADDDLSCFPPRQPSGLRNVRDPEDHEPRVGELTRRHTDGLELRHRRPEPSRRRASHDDIDMDLAYGELPPPLPKRKREDEIELRSKMSYLQKLLDEGNCVQHSVTAMIDNLQKNPDALAAVALTLAEISNIAAKMAPGALSAMKGAFPAVMALLASPQFAIAAGVGVGVTIIALGGYKIIKKIRARDEARLLEDRSGEDEVTRVESPVEDFDTLREIGRIEKWRRGIADEQANSVGTSVDGELVTPQATRTMIEEGRLTEADLKPREAKRGSGAQRHSKKKSKSEVSSASKSSKVKVKRRNEKEQSVLRSLFKGHSEKKREMEYV